MLETVEFKDSVLQFLKRCEALVFRRSYEKLAVACEAFKAQGAIYADYPAIPEKGAILVFKPDEMGDALYVLPALNELREKFPGARLFLLSQDKTKALYERTGLFEQVVGAKVWTRWLRFQFLDLESALDLFPVETFDACLFLRTYPAYYRYFKKIRAKVKVQPLDPRLKSPGHWEAFVTRRGHQSKQMLEIVHRVFPQTSSNVSFPNFQWTEEDKKSLEIVFPGEKPASFWVVHPYARFETRRYPEEYWRKLLPLLAQKSGQTLVIVGGKEDRSLSIPGTIEVQGKLSLTQTGYLLSQSSGFIGNESGPGHWASILGIPTAMIMSGHSHLTEWGPLGKSLVLRESVPCENCYLRACPKYKVKCLTLLTPEKIAPQILQFLGK